MKPLINTLAVLTAFASAAATAQAANVDSLAAKVNNKPIMTSELQRARAALEEQYRALMPEFLFRKDAAEKLDKDAMDKLIEEALLEQKAEAMKIKVYDRELDNGITEIKTRFSRSPSGEELSGEESAAAFRAELKKENMTLEEFREKVRGQLMVRKLVEQEVRPKVKTPSEAETSRYFTQLKDLMDGSEPEGIAPEKLEDMKAVAQRFSELAGERVRARHIQINYGSGSSQEKSKARKKAEQIKKELDGGLDFDEAVEKYSDDAESLPRGGDLGYAVRGSLPEEMEKTAFSMRVGTNSDPVETQYGLHILRLEEKRAAQKLRYEAVKEELGQLLTQENFASEMTAYLEKLKKQAKIEIFKGERKAN